MELEDRRPGWYVGTAHEIQLTNKTGVFGYTRDSKENDGERFGHIYNEKDPTDLGMLCKEVRFLTFFKSILPIHRRI